MMHSETNTSSSWNASAHCDEVVHIVPYYRCDFIRDVYDCQNNGSFIDYLDILYCSTEQGQATFAPVIELIFGLIVLFLLLGTTAGEYLCPALLTISRTLKMSQSVAGVTVLAFGNAAPDIVSTIAGVGQNRSSLVIGELFGGALYICTAVIGLLILLNSFAIPKSLLCDVLFYFFMSLWAFYIFHRGYIELKDALGFLAFYLVYLILAVVLPSTYSRIRKSKLFAKVSRKYQDESFFLSLYWNKKKRVLKFQRIL